MKRFARCGAAALLAAFLVLPSGGPAAWGGVAGASSTVRVITTGLGIAAVTDDVAASLDQIAAEPDKYVLRVEAAGAVGACTYTWTRTADGAPDGFSLTGAVCRLADHLELSEDGCSYVYAVEVRDEAGSVAVARVRVTVTAGYAERTLSAAGLTVSGSLHASASLEARVLSPDEPAYAALAEAAGDAEVVRAWWAEIAGAPEVGDPYVGTLEVTAATPEVREGAQVAVMRRGADGALTTTRATVSAGFATAFADSLGYLAVALPSDNGPEPDSKPQVTVTVDVKAGADAGEGGTVAPSGTFTVAAGSSQTFFAYPDEGFDLEAVFVNGKAAEVHAVGDGAAPPAAPVEPAAARGAKESAAPAPAAAFLRSARAPAATAVAAPAAEEPESPAAERAYWFTVSDLRDDTVIEVLFRRLADEEAFALGPSAGSDRSKPAALGAWAARWFADTGDDARRTASVVLVLAAAAALLALESARRARARHEGWVRPFPGREGKREGEENDASREQ